MAKKAIEKEDPHRQITPVVVGEAAEIFEWLEDLFKLSPRDVEPGKIKTQPDEMPERVVLRQMLGRDMGPEIKSETWKPTVSPLPSREALVMLANKFLACAQRDASVQGRRSRYLLLAYSPLKGSAAYERHPFVLMPGGKEFKESEAPATDDEDTHRDRLLSMALDHTRWKDEQFAESVSGIMKLQQEIICEQRVYNTQLEADRRASILVYEEALSKAEDRKLKRAWHEAKFGVLSDLMTSIRGQIIPAVTAKLLAGNSTVPTTGTAASTPTPTSTPTVGVPSPSQEQIILGRFLSEFEGKEELAEKLFGKEDEAGKPIAAGVFSRHQAGLIFSVHRGFLPAEMIDDLIPPHGRLAITDEQRAAALPLMTPSMTSALLELIQLRQANGAK